MRRQSRDPESGFVLLVVLWATALLALLVAGLMAAANREARLAWTLREQAIGRGAADAVLSAMVLEGLRSGLPARRSVQFGTVAISVLIQDYSGRLNPNIASAAMLQALLLELGIPTPRARRLAAAIVDWRAPSPMPSPDGAKAADYLAAGLRYGPPGRPFQTLDELGSVLGMDVPTLAMLKPHLTLWSTSDPVATFADQAVLAALRATGAPPVAGSSDEARVIGLSSEAVLPDGLRVTRRAIVRLGYSPDGRSWRILAWDDGEPQ